MFFQNPNKRQYIIIAIVIIIIITTVIIIAIVIIKYPTLIIGNWFFRYTPTYQSYK